MALSGTLPEMYAIATRTSGKGFGTQFTALLDQVRAGGDPESNVTLDQIRDFWEIDPGEWSRFVSAYNDAPIKSEFVRLIGGLFDVMSRNQTALNWFPNQTSFESQVDLISTNAGNAPPW